MQVFDFVDTRPKWMIKEDEMVACFFHCSNYNNCSSRFGQKCKQLGGEEIPKVKSKSCHKRRAYK